MVRLAIGEWHHWLEGVAQPFLVWTDHKNLEYYRSAKRLSLHQARWALFFGHFNFTLLSRPGSKNLKSDALSLLFWACRGELTAETILPRGDEWWRPFAECPYRRYSGNVGCHPSTFLVSVFGTDVRESVWACVTSAQFKSLSCSPARLLHPLLIPSRPWSHNALDFVTELPQYSDNNGGSNDGGSFVQDGSIHSPSHASLCLGDCTTVVGSCLPSPWLAGLRCFR